MRLMQHLLARLNATLPVFKHKKTQTIDRNTLEMIALRTLRYSLHPVWSLPGSFRIIL